MSVVIEIGLFGIFFCLVYWFFLVALVPVSYGLLWSLYLSLFRRQIRLSAAGMFLMHGLYWAALAAVCFLALGYFKPAWVDFLRNSPGAGLGFVAAAFVSASRTAFNKQCKQDLWDDLQRRIFPHKIFDGDRNRR